MQNVGGEVAQLDDHVGCAPEVGDLVFEESTSEGEDAVYHLDELDDNGVVECLLIEEIGEKCENRQRRKSTIQFGLSINTAVSVIQGANNEWCKQHCERNERNNGNTKESANVD